MKNLMHRDRAAEGRTGTIALAVALLTAVSAFGQAPPAQIVVVSVEGCGVPGATATTCAVANGTGATVTGQNATPGGYGDNQAGPLSLFYFNATGVSSAALQSVLVLPQAASGSNLAVSGEYGSSSEGSVQLSGNGTYLTIMGYGVNANAFNANPNLYSATPNSALAQSGSLTGQSYTPIPRVVALIDQYGNVNSSTGVLNTFDNNNPRSAYTLEGTNIWVSGQGASGDTTSGVFFTTAGSVNTAPASITGNDAENGATQSQDTRFVQIDNGTLYISMDSKAGANNRSYVGTLGTPTPPYTATYSCTNAGGDCPTGYTDGPSLLKGFGNNGGTGREQLTAAQTNGIVAAGTYINLSPENYFFANASTLYVADSGTPKNTSAQNEAPAAFSLCGAGGLQKWVKVGSTWTWEYTLYQGLNLVENPNCSSNTDGTTGLLGLTGTVVGNTVYLYGTSFTIADLDPTYLYGITDVLSATTNPGGESFTLLATAPPDSNFKGVSLAPSNSLPATNGVAIASVPTGLQFTTAGTGCAPNIPGSSYTTPATLNWTPGSTCTVGMSTPQNGPAGVQYTFSNWQDNTTNPAYGVTAPSSPTIYTATFTTQYELTTSATTGGTVSAGGYFNSGTGATITATPSAGYYFVNFTGTTTSTSNPLTLAMNGPQTITANFAAQTTPTITWNAPPAITFGSALGNGQLDATASVPGTFVYTPAAGTVLPVGNGQTLSVVFTPTDMVHYTTANGSTTINVNPAAPPASPANLVITKVLTRSGNTVYVQLTVANTGGTAAANVTITSVKVGSDTATPLPQTIGTIAAGGSAQATFSVPGSVGASGAASSLTVSGTYTGGTVSSSARITLP